MRKLISMIAPIFLSVFQVTTTHSSFSEEQVRYVGPFDLIALLNQKFSGKANFNHVDCLQITDKNKNLIGVVDPSLGKPPHEGPGPSFVQWYGNCLLSLIDGVFKENHKWEMLYGKDAASALAYELRKGIRIHWKDLSISNQMAVVNHWTMELIGPPEVLKDLGHVENQQEFSKIILGSFSLERKGSAISLTDATKHIIFLIAMRDEFLSY